MILVSILALLVQMAPPSDHIAQAVTTGIRAGAFPGAVVVVGTGGGILHAQGYGHLTWSRESPRPDPQATLYDLASLTKVVATTPAIMRLVDGGQLDLSQPVQRFLPGFVGLGKDQVTVRHLLEHRSGLRAFLPLHQLAGSAEGARRVVLEEPLRWKPGGKVEYSDLNAMLLGWIVERVAAVSLAEYAKTEVFGPLGMSRTRFKPPHELRSQMAPVGLWRGHVIAGELHDQNAVRLGGVSGHAGLYSTGLDLARYAQLYLRGGRNEAGEPVIRPPTIARFTRRGPGNRALGWEMRDTTQAANTGRLLSPEAFGHGGFTGTSIWIDPTTDLFVVVLTNRVFAPKTKRSITTLKGVRGKIADAAVALREEVCSSTHTVVGRTRSVC